MSAARRSLPMAVVASMALVQGVEATENVARRPFAEWADLPEKGQIVVSPWYMEAEGYHIWRGNTREDVNVIRKGEDYGVDSMNGIIGLQYGIAPKWAADLEVGIGTVGTRSFNAAGESQSTTGLMDTTAGVRYQIFNEAEADSCWIPTLTVRFAGVVPGSYDKDFPFAPGNHSAAVEPSVLAKKHFGWKGFGAYADSYFRWMRTSGDDQYMASGGFFQEIKNWTIDAGYRHYQMLSGEDIVRNGYAITYSPEIKEISEAVEAGFNYRTTSKKYNYGFQMRKILDGRNTDSAFWLGVYADFTFGGAKKKAATE